MASLIAIPPVFVFLTSLVLGRLFRARFPARWWLFRLGLLPLIGLALAIYILATPIPIPPNYDGMIHTNTGRHDFAAIMIYGVLLPTFYVAVALPTCVVYALWKRRDKAQDTPSYP
jgi:hypothetical protein